MHIKIIVRRRFVVRLRACGSGFYSGANCLCRAKEVAANRAVPPVDLLASPVPLLRRLEQFRRPDVLLQRRRRPASRKV